MALIIRGTGIVTVSSERTRGLRFWRLLCGGASLCAFVVVVGILLLYLLHFHRPYFSSDDAVVNMLAETMWRQGSLLPHGWVSNNGDLMVPSGSLIVAPLLHWLPNGFVVHALAGVFATFLMLGSLIWFLRGLRMPWAVVLLLATLFASGFSFVFTEMIFAQTTYVWWPAGFFLGAALICRHRVSNASLQRGWLTSALLFLLVFSISFANPERVALMMVVPLYLFDRILACGLHDDKTTKPAWRRWARLLGAYDCLTLAGLGAGFLAATFVYFALSHAGVTETSYNAAALHWGGLSSVWKHAVTFKSWFAYLGASSHPFAANNGLFAWQVLFSWGIALWLTWVGISEVSRLRRQQDIVRRALAVALLGSFLPIFLMYLLFEPLAAGETTLRYFTTPICIMVALAAFGLNNFLRNFPRIGRVGMAVAGVLLISISVQHFIPDESFRSADFWGIKESRTMQLARVLQREHLAWGYAAWWNAGSTTVQSDSTVRVLPVTLGHGGVRMFSYMVSRDWYRPEAWSGETFLALTHAEMTRDQSASLRSELGEPLRSIDSPDFHILVYGHNISADFTCPTQAPMNAAIIRGTPSARIVSVKHRAVEVDGTSGSIEVEIHNAGMFPVSGTGRYPMSIGVRLLDEHGTIVNRDWVHWPLVCPIDPGNDKVVNLVLPDTAQGNWRIRVDLVQEGVTWLGDWGAPTFDIPLAAKAEMEKKSSGVDGPRHE